MPEDVGSYFQEIGDSIRSAFTGMRITLKYWVQKPADFAPTHMRVATPPRYRGIHEFDADNCTGCDRCISACPVNCIAIEKTGPREIDPASGRVNPDDPRNGQLLRFAIDYGKCMFCGLCTEACPTNCLQMGKSHTLIGSRRQDLIVDFVEMS